MSNRTWEHNHKDFECDTCQEWFMIRDDSKLNICFKCEYIACDTCYEDHEENHANECNDSKDNKEILRLEEIICNDNKEILILKEIIKNKEIEKNKYISDLLSSLKKQIEIINIFLKKYPPTCIII